MFLRLVRRGVKQTLSVEEWAERNQHKATPDGIISAAVIQSFVSHFEDWKGRGSMNYSTNKHLPAPLPELPERKNMREDGDIHNVYIQNMKTETEVIFHYKKRGLEDERYVYRYRIMNRVTVNGLQLDAWSSRLIVNAFMKIMSKIKAVEATAAKAKADMERNEKAWNLAESLLGMKRNEFGALVPIKTAEGENANGGQTEQAPIAVRRETNKPRRTPKRPVRQPSDALSSRLTG